MKCKTTAFAVTLALACLSAGAATAPAATNGTAAVAAAKPCEEDSHLLGLLDTDETPVRKAGGARSTTLYLRKGAYVVRRCDASGRLDKATLYRSYATPGGGPIYQPTRAVEALADGKIVTLTVEYAAPDAQGAKALWERAAADAPSTIEPPARNDLLTRVEPIEQSREQAADLQGRLGAEGRAGAKCTSDSYTFFNPAQAWLPSRGFGYYVNLPNQAWDAAVEGGRIIIDDRWNDCGFQVPRRTSSYRIGYWHGGGWNTGDQVNMVTWTNSAYTASICGSPAALACASTSRYPTVVNGNAGPTYQAAFFDMLFNTDHCWVDGAGAGCYDIRGVAAHEFLHVYGIDHNGDPNSIMYPDAVQAYGSTAGRYQSRGDINSLAHLYGNQYP